MDKEAGEECCLVKSLWFIFLAPKLASFSLLLFMFGRGLFVFVCLGFFGWFGFFFSVCFLLFSNEITKTWLLTSNC